MFSIQTPFTNVVDARHPDLVVVSFVRKQCPEEVPVAMLNLMESFYSMWNTQRLSSSELQSIKSLTRGQMRTVDLFRLRVNGGVIQISLVADLVLEDGMVSIYLKVSLPPTIEYIAGYFGGTTSGTKKCEAPWTRANNLHSEIELTPSLCIPISEMQSCTKLEVSSYLEITQIKFVEKAKMEDFDITPSFKKQGQFQWVIEGEELKTLQTDSWNQPPAEVSTMREEWKFKLFRKGSVSERSTDETGVKIDARTGNVFGIDVEHPFLPLDVHGYVMKIIIRYQDKVMQSERTYKMNIMTQPENAVHFIMSQPLELVVWDIKRQSRIELDVEWKLEKLCNLKDNEI